MEILTTGYLDIYKEALKQGEMTEIVDHTMDLTNKISKHIVEDIILNLEKEIRISEDRKRNWYVQRNDDIKTISTLIGPISYKRTYYKNNITLINQSKRSGGAMSFLKSVRGI